MESQPQNPEFRSNPKNFYPCFGCGRSDGSAYARLVLALAARQCDKYQNSMNWLKYLHFFLLSLAY